MKYWHELDEKEKCRWILSLNPLTTGVHKKGYIYLNKTAAGI